MSRLAIRDICADDSLDLWEWRNDPLTRKNSRSTDFVPRADHERWFEKTQASPESVTKMIEADGVKAGVVRFDCVDQSDNSWQISITIRPQFRGQGLGRKALEICCQAMEARVGDCRFVAEARSENIASRRIFENCGFRIENETDGFLKLVRTQRHRLGP